MRSMGPGGYAPGAGWVFYLAIRDSKYSSAGPLSTVWLAPPTDLLQVMVLPMTETASSHGTGSNGIRGCTMNFRHRMGSPGRGSVSPMTEGGGGVYRFVRRWGIYTGDDEGLASYMLLLYRNNIGFV